MADSRVPCNPLESFKVPDDVKIRLAELELELSEGKYQNYSYIFIPTIGPVFPVHRCTLVDLIIQFVARAMCIASIFIHVLVLVNLWGIFSVCSGAQRG